MDPPRASLCKDFASGSCIAQATFIIVSHSDQRDHLHVNCKGCWVASPPSQKSHEWFHGWFRSPFCERCWVCTQQVETTFSSSQPTNQPGFSNWFGLDTFFRKSITTPLTSALVIPKPISWRTCKLSISELTLLSLIRWATHKPLPDKYTQSPSLLHRSRWLTYQLQLCLDLHALCSQECQISVLPCSVTVAWPWLSE